MYFIDQREHFFRPLTGKYREVVVVCLRLLYQRLYTDLRDYGYSLSRDQLLDIFQEAIARAPVLDQDNDDSEVEGRFKSQRELATFMLNRLLDSGWLEKQVDEATLQSTFGFSRAGRLFTQPFVELQSQRVRTRHRNTRNTRNSLQAFLDTGEVHDLLDAYEYSERIISDFTDIIAELEERKRQLVREVEARQLVQQASDQFFEFMEKRFQPDVAIRLSADSVEKYRDDIADIVSKIRRKRKHWKSESEFKLRELMADHVVDGQSLLWNLLDGIDARLRNASEVMLPALRKALHSFTQRADIIMRQLSYLAVQQNNNVLDICQALVKLTPEQQSQKLSAAGHQLAGIQAGFIDPAQVKLQTPKVVNVVNSSVDDDSAAIDMGARKELYVQQLLDQAFLISDAGVRQYVADALSKGDSVCSHELPIATAQDLLAAAHVIEVANSSNVSYSQAGKDRLASLRFVVEPLGERQQNEYFSQLDGFSIRLQEVVIEPE